MIEQYNAAVAATAGVISALRAKLDAARTAGMPASALAALTQAVTQLTEELRAVTQTQSASAENLARVSSIQTRANQALAAADRQIAAGESGRTMRVILSTGLAAAAIGVVAWGLWTWTQRDRY